MLWTHSHVFVQILRLGRDHPKMAALFREVEDWVTRRTPLPLSALQLRHMAWSNLPQAGWPFRLRHPQRIHSSLRIPCLHSELRCGLTTRVREGPDKWPHQACESWPLLSHVLHQCEERRASVQWKHDRGGGGGHQSFDMTYV